MILSQPARCRSAGFTLLETLLALALSAGLLVATFGALHQYYWLESCGNEQVKDSQATIGSIQDMEADLQRISPMRVVASEPGQDGNGRAGAGLSPLELQIGERFLQLGETDLIPVLLHGEPTCLAMLVAGHNSRFADAQTASEPLGLEQVVWCWGRGAMIGGPFLRRATRTVNQSLPSTQGIRGLLRVVTPFDGRVRESSGQANVVLDELVDLRFRYFDGQRWRDRWSTADRPALPRAVELRLQVSETAESVRFLMPLAAATDASARWHSSATRPSSSGLAGDGVRGQTR